MPSHQVRIASNGRDCAAQLQARDAKGAAPMIQAIGLAHIYAQWKMPSAGAYRSQFHIYLPLHEVDRIDTRGASATF